MTAATDLRFLIKICGITNEEDAQIALDAGANALGFNFYSKSPRHITPTRAKEIVDAVSGEFLRVGVFVNAASDELTRTAEQVPLDVLQLHGEVGALQSLKAYRIWKAIAPNKRPNEEGSVEAYLLDTVTLSYGGSGRTFDWNLAAKFPHRAIIAGGLDADNVAQAIEAALPWGVDACSRLECSPGKKDQQRVRDFVHAALEAMGMDSPARQRFAKSNKVPQEKKL